MIMHTDTWEFLYDSNVLSRAVALDSVPSCRSERLLYSFVVTVLLQIDVDAYNTSRQHMCTI